MIDGLGRRGRLPGLRLGSRRPALVAVATWGVLGLSCGGVCALGTGGGGGSPPVDPAFQGAPTCPSDAFFTGDATAGSSMYPGEPCNACHAKQGGPMFAMGGTVFATGKVLDDCLPSPDLD